MDLAAGPVSYGPRFDGDGLVTASTMPRVDSFKAAHAFRKQEFIADLAAFVSRACEYLIASHVASLPPDSRQKVISIVYISEQVSYSSKQSGSARRQSAHLIDWAALESELSKLVYFGQVLSLTELVPSSSDMMDCLVAYRKAVRLQVSSELSGSPIATARVISSQLASSLRETSLHRHCTYRTFGPHSSRLY